MVFRVFLYYTENGKIIEEGTHTELMKKMGKYRELYMAQAQWYV